MITDKESDQLLGLIQAIGQHLSDEKGDIIEIGYFLSEKERGNGYMTEAVCALRDELFAYLCVNGLVLKILPDHDASQRGGVLSVAAFIILNRLKKIGLMVILITCLLTDVLLREDYESLQLAA